MFWRILNHWRNPIFIAFSLGCLTACATQSPVEKPEMVIHDDWAGALKLEESLNPAQPGVWWHQFHDELLNGLIDEATRNNHGLAEALANIEKAKATYALAESGGKPSIDLQATNSRNRFSSQTGFGLNTGIRNSINTGLEASWEPDFFGKNSSLVVAASAQVGAYEALYDAIELTVIAEVSINYFEVRGLQKRLSKTEDMIKLLTSAEAIVQAQIEAGTATTLALVQAQAERENVAASIPNLKAEMSTRIYRISVLTGQPPETHLKSFEASVPMVMPSDKVPLGLRSDILKRRPDMQQAEFALVAASADLDFAKADNFPSFSLTGAIGSSVRVFSDLFTTGTITGSLAEALRWSLYDGGASAAKIDVAESENKAALARYQQSVLLALEDAESALTRYGMAWQSLSLLNRVEASRQQALDIAKVRYDAGVDSLITVIDAERDLINTRNQIIQNETQILTYLALLYKALGGGWNSETLTVN